VVVSASSALGTVSAQPATDRSLTATDKPATESSAGATNAPASDTSAPPQTDTKVGAGDITPADLSGLTREQLEARVKTLTDSLAAANKESEHFREQWTELRLRDEALGVLALTADQSKLEDRVVQTMAELCQTEMKRREALVLLDKLLTTTDKMMQTAPNYDPKVRAEYEEASRSAKAYMAGHSGAAIPLGTSLADGKVADTNPELNAVILNLGKTQGVKEGMPFGIFRDNVEIATVKVVLARDLVSAAQVENLKKDAVLQVGDRATVLAVAGEGN
jgi:hypothetical protein